MSWKDIFPQENRYFETKNGIFYCGDCLEIMKRFPNESVDLVLTDPPYGVGSNDKKNGYEDRFYNVENLSSLLFNKLKANNRCLVFSAQKTFVNVLTEFEKKGFKFCQTLIWHFPNLAGGAKKVFDFTSTYEQILLFHKGKPSCINKLKNRRNIDVLVFTKPQSNYKFDKRYHIHQKPIALIEHLLLFLSVENDLVLDPFLGSGTTAVVCEKLNRRWIGIEINSKYCEIAKKRILEILT